jgi:hypothetical protein
MCFVWISKQTAIISLYSINWLVFITEMELLIMNSSQVSVTFSAPSACVTSVMITLKDIWLCHFYWMVAWRWPCICKFQCTDATLCLQAVVGAGDRRVQKTAWREVAWLYCWLNIVRVMKWGMRWAGHVVCSKMLEMHVFWKMWRKETISKITKSRWTIILKVI